MLAGGALAQPAPSWPPAPERALVRWEGQITCADLSPARGLLGRIGHLLGGGDDREILRRPFDVFVDAGRIYAVFQDRPALVAIDTEDGRYREYRCDESPLQGPVAGAATGAGVLVSDSVTGTVYRLEGEDLRPFITGLERPTGLCRAPGHRVLVVETGRHTARLFDEEGQPVGSFGNRGEGETGFNFPTFAAVGAADTLLVNDTLNYRVTAFVGGKPVRSIGQEGALPGGFVRPKGIARDEHGRLWVVDAVQDNIQVFAPDGTLVLVLGSRGSDPGTFWSPCGISIDGDRVYVADTYNDRIQILRLLGG